MDFRDQVDRPYDPNVILEAAFLSCVPTKAACAQLWRQGLNEGSFDKVVLPAVLVSNMNQVAQEFADPECQCVMVCLLQSGLAFPDVWRLVSRLFLISPLTCVAQLSQEAEIRNDVTKWCLPELIDSEDPANVNRHGLPDDGPRCRTARVTKLIASLHAMKHAVDASSRVSGEKALNVNRGGQGLLGQGGLVEDSLDRVRALSHVQWETLHAAAVAANGGRDFPEEWHPSNYLLAILQHMHGKKNYTRVMLAWCFPLEKYKRREYAKERANEKIDKSEELKIHETLLYTAPSTKEWERNVSHADILPCFRVMGMAFLWLSQVSRHSWDFLLTQLESKISNLGSSWKAKKYIGQGEQRIRIELADRANRLGTMELAVHSVIDTWEPLWEKIIFHDKDSSLMSQLMAVLSKGNGKGNQNAAALPGPSDTAPYGPVRKKRKERVAPFKAAAHPGPPPKGQADRKSDFDKVTEAIKFQRPEGGICAFHAKSTGSCRLGDACKMSHIQCPILACGKKNCGGASPGDPTDFKKAHGKLYGLWEKSGFVGMPGGKKSKGKGKGKGKRTY